MYLELKDVKFSYEEQNVLNGISFGIEKGEITGLIGENGAGKTTTIFNIVKKLTPSSGKIIVGNRTLREIPMDDLRVSYIPDEPIYYEELTLLEHLRFVQALYPNNKKDINDIINRLDLNEHLHKIPSMLSKGTVQKLMISLALIREYDLLIADEPFNGLDPKQISVFKEILRENRTDNKAILISTHLLDLIEDLCDKYVIIHKGKIIAQGTKKDIISKLDLDKNSSLEQVYLETINR